MRELEDEQCNFCYDSGRFTELDLVRYKDKSEVLCCEACQAKLGLSSGLCFMEGE